MLGTVFFNIDEIDTGGGLAIAYISNRLRSLPVKSFTCLQTVSKDKGGISLVFSIGHCHKSGFVGIFK
jgi:hypothetical protein